MSNLVEKFGAYVGKKINTNPGAANQLLLTAYRGKRIQLKRFPDKRLSPARDYMAIQSMNAVIDGLAHHENSALVNIFMPCELLHVFGVHPMFAEAVSSYINGAIAEKGFLEYAEGCGIAETYCSYHRILMGDVLSNTLPKPKFVVNSSLLCDANNLTFRMAADHYQVPHIYIDVPYERSEESIAYTADQLREFAAFLEDTYHRKLSMDALSGRVAVSKRTMEILWECQRLKKGKLLMNDLTSELYEVFGTHVLLGTPQIETYARMLREDIKASAPTKGVRLFWMHTMPYYQPSLRQMLNFSARAQVLTCDMNTDLDAVLDPARPFESMAARMVENTFNGPSDHRIRRAIEMCRMQEADGVVYFCHWGCKQTMGAAHTVKQALEAEGIPVLILDGDACDRGNTSNGQMVTRLEAFIEMLEEGK